MRVERDAVLPLDGAAEKTRGGPSPCAFARNSSSSDFAQTNSYSSPPASGWTQAKRRRHITWSVRGWAPKGLASSTSLCVGCLRRAQRLAAQPDEAEAFWVVGVAGHDTVPVRDQRPLPARTVRYALHVRLVI